MASPNFGFLAEQDPVLAQHAARAERYVFDDPVVALVKLRQFAEVLAQQVAAQVGLFTSSEEQLIDLLRRLKESRVIDMEVADLFHAVRVAGNRAVHENAGTQREALRQTAVSLGSRRIGDCPTPAPKGGRVRAHAIRPRPGDRKLGLRRVPGNKRTAGSLGHSEHHGRFCQEDGGKAGCP